MRIQFRVLLCGAATTLWLAAGAPAQRGADAAETARLVARAIDAWVGDYERGRLGPQGILRSGSGLQPGYVAFARAAELVEAHDGDRLTHLDLLQKLLLYAERHPSTELADAVLGLSATGLEAAFLDHESLLLRDLGHASLLRMDHQGAWFLVLRAAAGERVPLFGELQPEDRGAEGLAVGPARRVAALRLLGQKALPVFRSTIEAALVDPDPRVRLGAVEAMELQRRPESLPKVTAALETERHPVVSQGLVRLLLGLLRTAEPPLAPEVRTAAVRTALQQLGRIGWRTDMDLLDLVEAYPQKQQIPLVITALELAQKPPDRLVQAVNAQASPLLRQRAGALLRAMTGALLPADDPAAWREFWQREQDRIVVPDPLVRDRPDATAAQFFGVPVTGRSIAFVIDTSGSMDELVGGTAADERRTARSPTRLRAAKQQLVTAVQAMPPASQYLVLTFAAEAKLWTSAPVRSGARNLRSLTELLSRLRAHGGTNLFAGLAEVLEFDRQRWGEQGVERVDEVFLLSDGEPTAGDVQDPDELLRLVQAANKYAKVRIHTVFTGDGPGADLLRRLAEQNGGVFVQR
ncbi:MAG: VWA domain-containing protein [Planctomycetes bacterium]|nr:VWA domain-containing protein [Planctomycetota bacterium]